jgi:STE24 endopeptidase
MELAVSRRAGFATRRILAALAFAACAIAWLLAAHALWRSSVPSALKLPQVDPRSLFSTSYLASSRSYEQLLTLNALAARLVLVGVLILYARRGAVLMRESAAGRIGTGMLLGMLGFAIVWIAELPFGLLGVWWERRHGVSHEGYVTSVLNGFFALGGEFLWISFALLVAMGFAGLTKRWWWALAAPAFAALALLSTFLSVYLIPETKPLRNPATVADVRTLARAEGIPRTKAEVQDVHRFTTAPNAESVGFGPTKRVILWDTLLDGRFDRREVRVVTAHELGHLAHHHTLKRVGWLILFLIPAAAIVAAATARRGGLARPEAVPLALLVFVVLQLLCSPLMNIVSRHDEAEADWSALRATHDPQAARALFVKLAETSHADPDPPGWAYVLYADHPTIVQRVAMVEAWQARR